MSRRRKLRILRFALWGAKAQSLRCSSFPHQTHFVGLWRGPHFAAPLNPLGVNGDTICRIGASRVRIGAPPEF